MQRSTLGIFGICLVFTLGILIVALPVSGFMGCGSQDGTAGQCNGQVFLNGTSQEYQQNGFGNASCIREDCPNNGTQKRDGSGSRSGHSGKGCGNSDQSGNSCQGCSNQSQR